MPEGEVHQRKGKSKKSKSKGKGKGQGGSASPKAGTLDGQDELPLLPPIQPVKKAVEEKVAVAKVEEESSIFIGLQVLFPYLLAGMGMVMAGMVLDSVQVSAPCCLEPRYPAFSCSSECIT